MSPKEYILFCDESSEHGPYYADFYGGLIVSSIQYQRVSRRMDKLKSQLNIHAEVKWTKVTENYEQKYCDLMTGFFDEVRADNVRVRIMFRQTARQATGLSREQEKQRYYLLYYQFIKHAFGLPFLPPRAGGTNLRLYFDEFPDTGEKVAQFKGFLQGLGEIHTLRKAGVRLLPENIAEVRSNEHILLQCVDVVLGAMQFRLNDRHKLKPPGSRIRGKRTRAKEKLYKHILTQICTLRPNFNCGANTACTPSERWSAPYLHWNFQPKNHALDESLFKHR